MNRHNIDEAAWDDESLPWPERVEARRLQLQEEALAVVRDTAMTRIITTEEAERAMVGDFRLSENDWRQQQLMTSENSRDIATLRALFDVHCKKSEHMDATVQKDVRTLSDNMTRVLAKLENGINEDLREIKESMGHKLDAAIYQGDKQQGQQTRKWRLEILTVITAICAVAGTVAGILL